MIVVTAPTSNIGSRVLAHLLESDDLVRVIVRDPTRLAPTTLARVEIFQGSHSDRGVLDRAFDGADTVFWLVPPNPRAESVIAAYVDFTRPAAELFRAKGVQRVVGVTALGRDTPQASHAGLVTGSLAMDDLISESGVAYRAVTNPSFMDNLLRQAQPIKTQGVFFGPIAGDRRMPICAVRDIAAVTTRWLRDPSWSGVDRVAVHGPEDLSFNDMAGIMSAALGKTVRYQQIPFDAYTAGFIERGMSPAMARGMTDMAVAKDAGLDNYEVRTLESTTPTTFRQWCEDELKPAVLA